MMKWKSGKETVNIGCIELGGITFDEERMGVSIDICDMSEELKRKVGKAVEVAKTEYTQKWGKWYAEHTELTRHTKQWSNRPVVMDYNYLYIVYEDGRPISYSIIVGFHDAENEHLETCADIGVNLSEYADELKIQVIKVLLDKFFG